MLAFQDTTQETKQLALAKLKILIPKSVTVLEESDLDSEGLKASMLSFYAKNNNQPLISGVIFNTHL